MTSVAGEFPVCGATGAVLLPEESDTIVILAWFWLTLHEQVLLPGKAFDITSL